MNKDDLYKTLEKFAETFPRTDGEHSFDYGEIAIRSNNESKFVLHQILTISKDAMISGALMQDIYSEQRSEAGREGWDEDLDGINGLKPEWIAIGNRNGCLLFSKTEIENQPVYGIITGSFEPFLITDSLSAYFDCLTEIMKIEQDKFQFVTDDDDCVPLQNFLSEVENVISKKLSQEAQSGFLEFFFG